MYALPRRRAGGFLFCMSCPAFLSPFIPLYQKGDKIVCVGGGGSLLRNGDILWFGFISIPLLLAALTVPPCVRGTSMWFKFIYPPLILLGGIKATSCRLCHRSRTDVCAHSSHFSTPPCLPPLSKGGQDSRGSLYQKGDKAWVVKGQCPTPLPPFLKGGGAA